MSGLSAPDIWEPLYECAALVAVSGFVPGAHIDIYAVLPSRFPNMPNPPERIGGGISHSLSGQVFSVDITKMIAGARLYATQTYNGMPASPISYEVVLQRSIGQFQPRIIPQLIECAKCLQVDGILPGALIKITDSSDLGSGTGEPSLLGSAPSYSSSAHVEISRPLVPNHILNANQIHCDTAGPNSWNEIVNSIQGIKRNQLLPAPEIIGPLYSCQRGFNISGCRPGSQVEVFVNTEDHLSSAVSRLGEVCASSTRVPFWVPDGLIEGTSITCSQYLCDGPLLLQSQASSPVPVISADDIPIPGIRGPLYEGQSSIVVTMTVAGEIVRIEADGVLIGMGGSGLGGDASFNVDPPLMAHSSIFAIVELCGRMKHSFAVFVRRRPTYIPPPTIPRPLLSCSRLVPVTGCMPQAKIIVYARDISTDNTIMIGKGQTFTNSIIVNVTPLLQTGWRITAFQEIGGRRSRSSSPPVEVQTTKYPDPPVIEEPIYECAKCIKLRNVLPGARLDVYQNHIWIGGEDNWTQDGRSHINTLSGLVIGSTITARQTICGSSSSDAEEVTVTAAPKEIPVPSISSAYVNDSFITVEGLIAGANVEVEETRTYNQVIGTVCANNRVENVPLNLSLLAEAELRVRQYFCHPTTYSLPVIVGYPREWPLGEGPFHAGHFVVRNIHIPKLPIWGGHKEPPTSISAVVFYPATTEGKNTSLAVGAPFPLIVFAHGKRIPGTAGSPSDITHDFQQFSGIFRHLARLGFIIISPDLSFLHVQTGLEEIDRRIILAVAVNYILSENQNSASIFHNKVRTSGIGAIGHSVGGLATIFFGIDAPSSFKESRPLLPVEAIGLIAPAGMPGNEQTAISSFSPKPVLVFHGTRDRGINAVGDTPLSIYNAARATKYLINIDGANHFGYTDSILMGPPLDGSATINQADQQRIAKAYLAAFFLCYLKGNTIMNDYLTGNRPVEDLDRFNITIQSQT